MIIFLSIIKMNCNLGELKNEMLKLNRVKDKKMGVLSKSRDEKVD